MSVGGVFVNGFGSHLFFQFSHSLAIKYEPVGIVDEAVQDGICECRLVNNFVPGVDRQLAGDEGWARTISVLDNLHEVATLAGIQTIRPPVIQDEQVDFCQAAEQR